MAEKIKIDNLTNAIMKELQNYSDEINEAVKVDIKEVAKETAKQLKTTSPKRYGNYAKSWGTTPTVKGKHAYKETVHNKKHYRLTHLLEFGHAFKNGGRARAFPHIKPAEDQAIKELEKRITETIQRT